MRGHIRWGRSQVPVAVLLGQYAEQLGRVLGAAVLLRDDDDDTEILELDMIKLLAGSGAVVICAGGGGVPVIRDTHGGLHGIEAVVDKDLTAALFAAVVSADMLLLLTDVAAVMDGYGTPHARPIRHATPAQLRARPFPAGSMAPKVAADCRFTETTGRPAAIGRLDDAAALLDGSAGTIVTP